MILRLNCVALELKYMFQWISKSDCTRLDMKVDFSLIGEKQQTIHRVYSYNWVISSSTLFTDDDLIHMLVFDRMLISASSLMSCFVINVQFKFGSIAT